MKHPCRIIGLAFLVALFAAGSTCAQEAEVKKSAQAEESPKKPPPDTKSVLMGASRASTAKAVEGAVKEKTKGPELEEASKPADDSAVTELRPIPPGKQDEAEKSADEKDKKKSKSNPLKGIHGSAYGGSGPRAQAAGASAGASTKSGKSSVYVQGQGVRQQ
jgi:hypothetical protein